MSETAGASAIERWAPRDSEVVMTKEFLLSQIALEDVIEYRAMGAFVGIAGTGKTFTIKELVASLKDVRVIWVEFENEPTERHMAQVLLKKLADRETNATRYKISSQILDELSLQGPDEPILLVIDEAQRLTTKNFEYLRYLHDHAQCEFALLFLGGNNCWEKLRAEPMLESRIFRRVNFRPMSTADVLRSMRVYHPMYELASDELIGRIDAHCRGIFRQWAQVTTTIQDLHQRRGVDLIDRDLALAAAELVAVAIDSGINDDDANS